MVAQDALGLHREPTLGGRDERTRATFQADQVSPSRLCVCAFQLNAFDLFRSVLFVRHYVLYLTEKVTLCQ